MMPSAKDEMAQPDRRRFRRHPTNLPLKLRTSPQREIDGCCVVISESGLAGILLEVISVGATVELRFTVPSRGFVSG